MKAKTTTAVARRKASAVQRVGKTNTLPAKKSMVFPIPEQDNSNAFLATLAIGAAGVVGYFGYEYYKKRAGNSSAYSPSANYLPSMDSGSTISHSDTTAHARKKHKAASYSDDSGSSDSSSDFPLKKGSKGDFVHKLQQALIDKYGSDILPKYGADGDFGSETVRGLKKAGYGSTVSKNTYNVITGGGSGGADTSKIAEELHTAGENGDFSAVLKLLKQIESKEDYQKVSTAYKHYTEGFVSKTLVNGMLDAFSSDEQKQQIRMEFLRMGLQYNGSKWSLSGIDGAPLITKHATTIWTHRRHALHVPARTVLGNEVGRKHDFTMFEHRGKFFLVKTSAVQHLK